MKSIGILTTSAYPEMEDLCRWMFARQTYGNVNHHLRSSATQGSAQDRRSQQIQLLRDCDTDLFMLSDDDDYIDQEFLERSVNRMDNGMYGEIVMRTYLMTEPAYGEASEPREFPFLTMVVFDRERWRGPMIDAIEINDSKPILNLGKPWVPSQHLIIMRGLMADPQTAITKHKNRYDPKHFPHRDPDYTKLREWLADDPEAFERYMEFARCA